MLGNSDQQYAYPKYTILRPLKFSDNVISMLCIGLKAHNPFSGNCDSFGMRNRCYSRHSVPCLQIFIFGLALQSHFSN